MSRPQPLDVAMIAAALDQSAEQYAPYLLPNGRRSSCRRWWETNSLNDNPTPDGGYSLKVEIKGPKRGKWRDHATAEAGDLLELATIRLFGGNKSEAIKWAKSELQLDNEDPARVERVRYQIQEANRTSEEEAAREREAKLRGARALWLSGVSIADTAAARYLEHRGIRMPESGWPGSLHFHEEVWNADAGVKLPAMLATMVTPDGVQLGCHRTWLGRDPRTRAWVKAEGADLGVPRRASKKVLGPCRGAFIPISKGETGRSMSQLRQAETIYITEGIEDALTVSMIRPKFRVVAGYSLSNIGAIEFPPLVEAICIVSDRDENPKPLAALERAIAAQQARGKVVQLVTPPPPFKDINEWLLASLPTPENA